MAMILQLEIKMVPLLTLNFNNEAVTNLVQIFEAESFQIIQDSLEQMKESYKRNPFITTECTLYTVITIYVRRKGDQLLSILRDK